MSSTGKLAAGVIVPLASPHLVHAAGSHQGSLWIWARPRTCGGKHPFEIATQPSKLRANSTPPHDEALELTEASEALTAFNASAGELGSQLGPWALQQAQGSADSLPEGGRCLRPSVEREQQEQPSAKRNLGLHNLAPCKPLLFM